jgi:transaldolase
MPTATLKAFLDHGRAKLALTENIEESISVMEFIKQIGMPISEITNTLLDNGVKQFDAAFDKLLNAAESGSLKRSPVAPDLGY